MEQGRGQRTWAYLGTVPTGVEEAAREEIGDKLRPAAVRSTMGKVRLERLNLRVAAEI